MSIIIKSGASANLLTVDSTGAARVTIYDAAGDAALVTAAGALNVNIAGLNISKTTYSAAINSLTPPATPTDMVTITGSATKTVKILRIELSTTQTTAGINTFFLVKRSTANSAGTSSAGTAVPHDSTNAAATATVLAYTANPTLGSAIGNVRATKVLTPAPASLATAVQVWEFDGVSGGQPVVLNGTSQVLALNFNGAALPTGLNVNCTITWTEE